MKMRDAGHHATLAQWRTDETRTLYAFDVRDPAARNPLCEPDHHLRWAP